jgi:hypothetical protein
MNRDWQGMTTPLLKPGEKSVATLLLESKKDEP